MTDKILYINPVGTDLYDQPIYDYLRSNKREKTEYDVVSFSRGPHHLEYHYYEALVLPDTLNRIKKAERRVMTPPL